MKASFAWYEITFKKIIKELYFSLQEKKLALGYVCDRHLINACE